ncbi:hypothetical protein GJAV_G00000800 [Gymnothorax javanicus]|nr:hypothetical protein GJAV_G00000800 [Gymnothorax javanicus]
MSSRAGYALLAVSCGTPEAALRHADHPILAVVPDPVREEDRCVCGDLVGRSLHAVVGLYWRKSDGGVCGSRRIWSQCGCCLLPALVDAPRRCGRFCTEEPDSIGHEAIFYSFYVFFIKFAAGISLGVSTLSLDFAGYVTAGCSQPEAVYLTLRMLVSPVPIVMIIVGLLILRTYPINEAARKHNHRLLQELRHGEDSDSSSDSDV